MDSSKGSPNGFQALSTVLALLLPVIQFFFNFLPTQSKSIFLIQNYFLIVSIIAALFAYLLIIAYKNTIWFQYAPNRKKNRNFKSFQKLVNSAVYNEEEIKYNTKKYQKDAPYYITPANVYYVLIPFVFALMLIFLAMGLFFQGSSKPLLIFTQSLIYIMLVALTSLTLGAFYINDSNRRRTESINKEKYRRVVQLLFDGHALKEFPIIEFVGQGSLSLGTLTTIVRVDNGATYQVVTDFEAGVLQTVEPINVQSSTPPIELGDNDEQ